VNIAIQKNLDSLKSILESKGHNVFYIGVSQNADAVLYSETDTHPYNNVNNLSSVTASTPEVSAAYGVLLVNVSNKSEEEVLRILDNRVYSPLF